MSGKEMATTLIEPLTSGEHTASFDPSTNGLLKAILKQQEPKS